jgi:hypothetical protein
MSVSREEREFLKLGVQYYVAARSAVLAGLLPVCGTLYHHSLELLLKAGLSRQHSLKVLRDRPFGHELPNLWTPYKTQFAGGGELDPFDAVIKQLHEFQDIRYPDKILKAGAHMMVTADSTMGIATQSPSPHLYWFNYNDVDRLVGKIFEVSGRNLSFFTSDFSKPHAREIISHENPITAQLLPP